MKKQRPVNLDLTTIKMHLAANASILHRVSGVIMVFAIGILLLTFQPLFLLLKDLPLFKIVLMAFSLNLLFSAVFLR